MGEQSNIQLPMKVQDFLDLFKELPKGADITTTLFAIEQVLSERNILDQERKDIIEMIENISDMADQETTDADIPLCPNHDHDFTIDCFDEIVPN